MTKYQIILREGIDISNISSTLQVIFECFNLPSWLGNDYDVRVLFEGINEGIKYHHIEAKESAKVTYHEVNLWFYEFQKDFKDLTILYYVTPSEQFNKQNQVSVRFILEKGSLKIMIDDLNNLFDFYFEKPESHMFIREYKSTADILEYRYIEPVNHRTIEQKEKLHFHLAFQGGGIKGIGYIGAYKALQDLYPNLSIKSIIGSSAGAIIALAISASTSPQLLIDLFKKMEKITNDVTVKKMSDITPEKDREYQMCFEKLKKALNDYGFIHEKTTELLVQNVLNTEVIDKIVNYLCGDNESLRNMFSIDVEEVVEKAGCCNQAKLKRTRKLVNYYGLLEGKLMAGEELENICTDIIYDFLDKLSADDLRPMCERIQTKDLRKISRLMNLRQFYIATKGLEFTCTAVDLNSKILRLFNQKTTPYLPVCKAVRMSGSFPIAYQPLKWKKEWGKYYIHYQKKRREVNLEGHQFTDGGMLANFPIIYLDNQQIRPLYFSNKPNEKTKLFGFGVDHIYQQPTKEEAERQAQRKKEMSQAIYKYLPILKFLAYQALYTPSSPELILSQNLIPMKEIPFIGFLIDIMQTYISSNDNFTQQCFARKIFFFDKDISFAQFIFNHKDIKGRITQVEQDLTKLHQRLETTQYSLQNTKKYLEAIHLTLSTTILTMNQLISIKQILINYLKQFSIFCKFRKHDEQIGISYGIDRLVLQLQETCSEAMFIKSELLEEEQGIFLNIIARLINIYSTHSIDTLKQKFHPQYEQFFAYMKQKEIQKVVDILEILQEGIYEIKNQKYTKYYQKKYEVIKSLITLKFILPNHQPQEYKQILDVLLLAKQPISNMIKTFQDNKEGLRFYIRSMLINKQSPNIHLVFQSKGASIHLNLQIYKLVNQYLFMQQNTKSSYLHNNIARRIIRSQKITNQQITIQDLIKFIVVRSDLIEYIGKNIYKQIPKEIDLGYMKYSLSEEVREKIKKKIENRKKDVNKITSITCSSIHSFLGFMIAVGLGEDKIHPELELLKQNFDLNEEQIENQFKRLDWVLPTKARIREFQQLVWQYRYKIFDEIEKSINRNQLPDKLKQIREEFEESREQIYESFNNVIEYIIKTTNSSQAQSDDEYVSKNLSIMFMGKNFNKINKQISRNTKEVMDIFLKRFYQQIRYFVMSYSSTDVLEVIDMESDDKKKEAMWKGVIINNFLKGDKLKFQIQRILTELNLPKNIKLNEFYNISPRKIELTFTAVELRSRKVVFINHNSYPEMPLWAGILIASSCPILFSEIRGQYSWMRRVQKIDPNNSNRFFNQINQKDELPLFISGNLMGSLPLQLLTNEKVREVYFDSKKYTFLTFAFKKLERKYNNSNNLIRSYLTFGDFIKLGLKQTINSLFGLSKLIEFGSNFITKQSMINTFMWCHDELIVQLYDKCLLKLPVKFGTLDFHKLKSEDIDGRNNAETTIERAYYITKEKFSKQKFTYIQFFLNDGILQFHLLSKQNISFGDITGKYKIYYKLSQNKEYQHLAGYQILIEPINPQVFLKFYYVQEQSLKIVEKEYYIKFGNIFTNFISFQGIYKLYYSVIQNGLLVPILPHTGRYSHYLNEDTAFKLPIRSIVDIKNHGLYCQICCANLFTVMNVDMLTKEECSKCFHPRCLKFRCSNISCSAPYCMVCCKNYSIRRTKGKLLCNKNHELHFSESSNTLFKEIEPKLKFCNLCMSCAESCYWDQYCDIQICQSCCSEFILL